MGTIGGFLTRLRFTPQLTDRPVVSGTTVYLDSVGEVADALRYLIPPAPLGAMRETLAVWHPFTTT